MANDANDRFVYVSFIATTPEKLWRALTDGEFTRQYFFDRRVESDWRPGSPVTYWIDEKEKDVTGEVLAADPPRKLSFTWGKADVAPERRSRVTFEIQPMGPVVKLTVLHEQLQPGDLEQDPNKWRGVNNGWPAILSNLKSLLETGKPCLAFPSPPRP